MGWPATVSVPAATVLTAVKRVLAKLSRAARVSQLASVVGVAAVSCGSGASPSSPPQADSAITANVALHRAKWERYFTVCLFVVVVVEVCSCQRLSSPACATAARSTCISASVGASVGGRTVASSITPANHMPAFMRACASPVGSPPP